MFLGGLSPKTVARGGASGPLTALRLLLARDQVSREELVCNRHNTPRPPDLRHGEDAGLHLPEVVADTPIVLSGSTFLH